MLLSSFWGALGNSTKYVESTHKQFSKILGNLAIATGKQPLLHPPLTPEEPRCLTSCPNPQTPCRHHLQEYILSNTVWFNISTFWVHKISDWAKLARLFSYRTSQRFLNIMILCDIPKRIWTIQIYPNLFHLTAALLKGDHNVHQQPTLPSHYMYFSRAPHLNIPWLSLLHKSIHCFKGQWGLDLHLRLLSQAPIELALAFRDFRLLSNKGSK
jgi:hypothetical protein